MIAQPAGRASASGRGLALAALVIAIGNIASRLLGLGRVAVIALFFGRSAGVDAYAAAWTIPNTVYDMLIAGVVSSALVPVLSEYAEGEANEFRRLVGGVFALGSLALALLLALLAWQAPLLTRLLVRSSRPELYPQTLLLVRELLPAVLCMGLAGVATAALYARREFLRPAFAGATFNAGVILGVALLHQRLDVASLAAGALIGGLGQLALQLSGLRSLHPLSAFSSLAALRASLGHPALRRIARLCAPMTLGVTFLIAGTLIDRWLASGFVTALATMQYATTLIQFPLGLVAAAVALAVLPTLARQSGADEDAFRRTLAMGLKVVLLLIVPAAVGLAALAGPITALLFERGAFRAEDTAATARALLCYLPGLPATALAQVLIFAFYARKNTLAPNLVQGAAVGVYLLAALPLLWLTKLGFLALVLGNSAQWIGHALLLLLLLRREVSLRGLRLGEALVKPLIASGLMAAAIVGLVDLLQPAMAGLPYRGAPVQIALAGGVGGLLYLGICAALRVEALAFFTRALAERLRAGGRRQTHIEAEDLPGT